MFRLTMTPGGWRGLLALAAGLCCGGALATSAPALTLVQRAQRSDRVVVAKVSGIREQALDCEGQRGCVRALTVATLTVSEEVKGSGGSVVEIALPAQADIAGAARFEVGERALVFLRCQRSAELAAARARLKDTVAPGAERCALYGFADAKLPVVKQDATDVVLVPVSSGAAATRPLKALAAELRSATRVEPSRSTSTPVMSTAPRSLSPPKTLDARDGRLAPPAPEGARR